MSDPDGEAAPGSPGIPPTWSSSDKDAVPASKVRPPPGPQGVALMTTEKPVVPHDDTAPMPTLARLGDHDKTISSADEDIRGRMVKDSDGQDLGKVDGLLVDAAEQKVRFMEVASGGFLGFGESKSLIPVEAITTITADEVHISHTRAHVAGAPRYDPALVTEEHMTDYAIGLYPYYGYPGLGGNAPWITTWPSRAPGSGRTS